jgi:hypothetical protein
MEILTDCRNNDHNFLNWHGNCTLLTIDKVGFSGIKSKRSTNTDHFSRNYGERKSTMKSISLVNTFLISITTRQKGNKIKAKTTTQKIFCIGLFIAVAMLCTPTATADVLRVWGQAFGTQYRFQVIDPNDGRVRNPSLQVGSITAQQITEESRRDGLWPWSPQVRDPIGDTYWAFCASADIHVSANYQNHNVGERMQAHSLADSPFVTDLQKNSLQTLINHTYTHLVDTRDYRDSLYGAARTEATREVEFLTAAIQLAVWGIMHEPDPAGWNFDTGYVMIRPDPNSSTSAAQFDTLVDLVGGWYDSILTGIWADPFANLEFTYELQFLQSSSTQPLLVIRDRSVIPEPATIAIMGLGLVGLGYVRARRKK